MNISDRIFKGFVDFERSVAGIITNPYQTYRNIIARSGIWEIVFVWMLMLLYFAVSSAVKTAAFRPFILTSQFLSMFFAALVTYFLVGFVLYRLAGFLRGQGSLIGVLCGWAYTLIPTFVWFLATSVLFLILPPPRTARPEGIMYSLLYLVFSAVMFYWKFMLAYLTLRFGMKLDLVRIAGVYALFVPLLGIYSVLMYKLGIFRIPFI